MIRSSLSTRSPNVSHTLGYWGESQLTSHLWSITVDFTPVEFSPTHCPRADVDVSLKDFPPASSPRGGNRSTHYPRKWIVSVRRVRTEHPVQPLLYLSISKPYQLSSTDPRAINGELISRMVLSTVG